MNYENPEILDAINLIIACHGGEVFPVESFLIAFNSSVVCGAGNGMLLCRNRTARVQSDINGSIKSWCMRLHIR